MDTISRAKIGIVIQGPLNSQGLNGRSRRTTREKVSDDDIVLYDCLESIKANVRQLPNDVLTVVATWSDEADEQMKKLRTVSRINHILSLDEPANFFQSDSQSQRDDFRQFWSTLQGVKKLEDYCTHVVKIRTDQILDIGILFEQLNWLIANKPKALLTPLFRVDDPFYLQDFFFGGELRMVREVLEELCAEGGKFLYDNSSVHTAFFRAFAKVKLDETHMESIANMQRSPGRLQKIWNGLLLSNNLFYRSIVWRGSAIEEYEGNVLERLKVGRYFIFNNPKRTKQNPKMKHLITAYVLKVFVHNLQKLFQ